MKKREWISSVKWNDKAKFYLGLFGYLDSRTGRTRPTGPSLNRFINEVVISAFENPARSPSGADSRAAERAHLIYRLQTAQARRDALEGDMRALAQRINELGRKDEKVISVTLG
jgi:hypothetical protein